MEKSSRKCYALKASFDAFLSFARTIIVYVTVLPDHGEEGDAQTL
jgi:hypothetical protein